MIKKWIISTLLILPTLCLVGQSNKKVLMIGIDGCRPDALAQAYTPNIDSLINTGIYSSNALNGDITISGPGWSAILCGVMSEKHQVFDNNFEDNNYEQFPSIFNYIDQFAPEKHTVSICNWNPINDHIIQEDADFKINASNDMLVKELTSNYLSVNDPDLIFLHFDDVDHVGHSSGFNPENPSYLSSIETIDQHIGEILKSLVAREQYEQEDWLILVTTDHGGIGNSHGGNTLEEQEVFFLASGPQIEQQSIVKDSTIIYDPIENCLNESQSLYFNNSDDFISLPNNENLSFGENQDFTIEFRVRTDQASDVSMLGNKDWESGLNPGFVFSFKYPSGPEWKVNIGDGENRVDLDVGGEIADNEWHSLAVSFDRDGMMTMYENGQWIAETDISSIKNIDTDQAIRIASDINGAYNYKGAIADLRIWNKVIQASDIQNWYCTSITDQHPEYESLVGYWKLNEGTGNIATDSGPNQFDATIENAQWISADSTIQFNYDHTPRLVDVAYTALAHLCIPLDSLPQLDGKSWIENCLFSHQSNIPDPIYFELFPNPADQQVTIDLASAEPLLYIQITNAAGKIVVKQKYQEALSIDTSSWPSGKYSVQCLNTRGQAISTTKSILVQHD